MPSSLRKLPAAPVRHEQFGQILHVVAKSWRQELDRRLKPLGLTRSKWLALIFISRSGSLSQRSLADKMEIGEPAVVALLDRLERDQLIVRLAVPGDRRARALELTTSGKRVISSIEAVAHALREELLAGFADAELDTAGAVLTRLKAKLEALQ